MKNAITYLVLFLLLLVSYSCANVLPLTGGDEDLTPPVVEKMDPPNQTVNNVSKKIIVEFDEFVVLKDPSKNILISPPGTKYEVIERGKKIQLNITDTLKTNTTYVINFGSAIADNNNGNILQNLVYSFSTGPAIDSLTTSFLVIDALTLKPLEGVRVMLYESDIDTLPYYRLPYYAGKTNEKGQVKIGYMATGRYKVFALKDENNSYTYDKPNESIGYIKSLVSAGDSIPIKVVLFQELPPVSTVKSVKTIKAGMVCFQFNGEVKKEQFNLVGNNFDFDTSKFEMAGTQNDSAIYWYTPVTYQDTLTFTFTNSLGNVDTIKSYPRTQKLPTGISYGLKVSNSIPAEFDYFKTLELSFTAPIDSIGLDSITFSDGNTVIPATLIPVNAIGRKLYLDYTFKEDKTYTLYFKKGSLKDIHGNYIDSTVVTIKTSHSRKYKTLTMNIMNPEYSGAGILELLNDKDEILNTRFVTWTDTNQVVYENLKVGNYRLRLVYDSNEDKKWNTGNYLSDVQPEKVVYFPQNIEIKSLFDLELLWDIMNPVKEKKLDER